MFINHVSQLWTSEAGRTWWWGVRGGGKASSLGYWQHCLQTDCFLAGALQGWIIFKKDAIKAAMIYHPLMLAGRGTKAILTMWCVLSVSPAQHPKDCANPMAAARGSEAAGAGGHLQDRSLCETWREWSEDWRDYPTLGGDDAQGLAALLRSLSNWLQGSELLGLTDADFPEFHSGPRAFFNHIFSVIPLVGGMEITETSWNFAHKEWMLLCILGERKARDASSF